MSMTQQSFAGKGILFMGAAQGVGRAVAQAFPSEGVLRQPGGTGSPSNPIAIL